MMRQLASTPRAAKRSKVRNFARAKRELALVTRGAWFYTGRRRALRGHPHEIPCDSGEWPSPSHPAHVPHALACGLLRQGEAGQRATVWCTTAPRSRISRYSTERSLGDLRQPSIWKALVRRVHLVVTHRMIQPNVKRRYPRQA